MDKIERGPDRLAWSALEYEERSRGQDWFWALGIIIVTASITAIIFADYFFSGLILLAGVLLWFFALKKPDLVAYELNPKGLKIRNRLYPYENIKSFFVQADLSGETNLKSILFIHSSRAFMPILNVPIYEEIAEEVHSIMTAQGVTEVEMREHPSERIMDVLGF